MPRKKISTDENSEASQANLDDDESLIVETTKRIRRERQKPEPELDDPPANEKIIDVDTNGDPIEDDEDIFAEGTLGSLLTQSADDELRSQQCNILVTRKADTPGEVFARPCPTRLTKTPLRNIDLTSPKSEIEEMVRMLYFGGHYSLQIQLGQTMGPAWSCDLDDPPDVHARMRAQEGGALIDAVPVVAAPVVQQSGDFVDDFIARAEKMKALKEAIFGDELRELTSLRQNAATAATTQAHDSPEMFLLKEALKSQNPSLQEKLLDRAMPPDPDGNKSMVRDVIDAVVEHQDKILPLVGGLFGMLFGGGGVAAPTNAAPTNGGAVGHPAPPIDPMAAFRAPAPVAVPPPVRESKMRQNMNAGASAEIDTTAEEDEVLDGTPAETIDPHPRTLEPAVE